MNPQFDFFSRSVDLFRNLSTALLTGSEEIGSLQLDSAQASITRGSKQLRAACSALGAMQQPVQSSEAVQMGIHNAITMTRDNVLAASDYQMEALRLLQQQGTELQKVIADSLNEQLAIADSAGSSEKRSASVTNLVRKRAA